MCNCVFSTHTTLPPSPSHPVGHSSERLSRVSQGTKVVRYRLLEGGTCFSALCSSTPMTLSLPSQGKFYIDSVAAPLSSRLEGLSCPCHLLSRRFKDAKATDKNPNPHSRAALSPTDVPHQLCLYPRPPSSLPWVPGSPHWPFHYGRSPLPRCPSPLLRVADASS